MKLEDFENEDKNFIKTFFSPSDPEGNLVRLEKVFSSSSASYSLIRDSISFFLEYPFQPTFIPRVVKDESLGKKKTFLYGISRSDGGLQQLTEEARSFFGPSHSSFRGRKARLYPERDEIEQAVCAYTRDRALRFRVRNDAFRMLLRRWLSVRERREDNAPQSTRSRTLVLRDFYTALRARRKGDCLALLQEVQERNLFDALNRRFLRIQYFHHFKEWEKMLDMDLEDVLSVRIRPPKVTEALIEALYHTKIKHLAEEERLDEARSIFWDQIHPQYSSLFDTQGQIDSTSAKRLFMLRACSPSEPRPDKAHRILQNDQKEDDFLYSVAEAFFDKENGEPVESLSDEKGREKASPLERARSAFEKSDFDTAVWWARQMNPGAEKARILLYCAYNLETTLSESTAVKAVDELSSKKREEVLNDELLQLIYSEISGSDPQVQPTTAVPDDWASWFRRLTNSRDWNQGRALNLARRGEEEWSVEPLATDASELHELTELIDDLTSPHADEKATQTFQHALVHFLGACLDDPKFPRESLAPLYDRLIVALSEIPSPRRSHLDLFAEIARARFRIGVNEEEYVTIVGVAMDLWEENASVDRADWGLDLLDMLVIYPKKADAPVVRLLSSIARLFQERRPRLDAEQVEFMRRLCSELGHEEIREPIPEPETKGDRKETDPIEELKGESIGLYTLDEGVGRRVRNLINEVADVEIRLNHDKQATDQLRAVAQNTDLMVVVTGCAKHAATNYIEDVRGEQPVVYPDGTGSSSIMRAIRKQAASKR